jgi:hypothetical protein
MPLPVMVCACAMMLELPELDRRAEAPG